MIITFNQFLVDAVLPALQIIGVKDTPQAAQMVYAIGLQESGFNVRQQYNNGPAASFFQFEKGGGIAGVIRHEASAAKAKMLCDARDVPLTNQGVWDAMVKGDDVLGVGFTRLLLLTDPRPLPALGDASAGWNTYQRNWRPGKPHPETWPAYYAQALRFVRPTYGV